MNWHSTKQEKPPYFKPCLLLHKKHGVVFGTLILHYEKKRIPEMIWDFYTTHWSKIYYPFHLTAEYHEITEWSPWPKKEDLINVA